MVATLRTVGHSVDGVVMLPFLCAYLFVGLVFSLSIHWEPEHQTWDMLAFVVVCWLPVIVLLYLDRNK
jgi:hypothetical protein